MKKQLLAIANWKMYQTQESVDLFLKTFAYNNEAVQIVVAPSFVHLSQVVAQKPENIAISSQNIAQEELGASTGEIGAEQLAEQGVNFAIIGHSERRSVYQETDEMIAKKLKIAKKYNITPILCVGETEAQKTAGDSIVVVLKQLEIALDGVDTAREQVIIAYEPVWAIGSGKIPTTAEIQTTIDAIRNVYGAHAQVVYGGSVSAENVGTIIAETGCDGVLIGKASTTAESLMEICENIAVAQKKSVA